MSGAGVAEGGIGAMTAVVERSSHSIAQVPELHFGWRVVKEDTRRGKPTGLGLPWTRLAISLRPTSADRHANSYSGHPDTCHWPLERIGRVKCPA